MLKYKINNPSGYCIDVFPNFDAVRTVCHIYTNDNTTDQFPNRDHLSHNYFERTELIGRDSTQPMTAWVSISKVSGPLYWKERMCRKPIV